MNGKGFQKNGIFIEKIPCETSDDSQGIHFYLTVFISLSIVSRIAPAAPGPSEFVSS